MKSLLYIARSFTTLLRIDPLKFDSVKTLKDAALKLPKPITLHESLALIDRCFSIQSAATLKEDPSMQPLLNSLYFNIKRITPKDAVILCKRLLALGCNSNLVWNTVMKQCKEGIETVESGELYYVAKAYSKITSRKVYKDTINLGSSIMKKLASNLKDYSITTLIEYASMVELITTNDESLKKLYDEIVRNKNEIDYNQINTLIDSAENVTVKSKESSQISLHFVQQLVVGRNSNDDKFKQ